MIGELYGKDDQKILVVDGDGYLWDEIDGDTTLFPSAMVTPAAKANPAS